MKAGLGKPGDGCPLQPGQQRPKQLGNLLRLGAAHIEQLYGAFPEDLPIVPIQHDRVNIRHLPGLSQPGQAEGVLPAHGPQQALHGVGPLVVQLGLYGGNQVLLFALHKGRQEPALFQRGFQKQLLQKCRHRLQHPVSRQGKPVIHKAAVQAGGLIVSHPANHRADGCAVQLIQPLGDGADIRVGLGAPQQHRRQQGIHGIFLRLHGADQL